MLDVVMDKVLGVTVGSTTSLLLCQVFPRFRQTGGKFCLGLFGTYVASIAL